jgi:hypothetical protein
MVDGGRCEEFPSGEPMAKDVDVGTKKSGESVLLLFCCCSNGLAKPATYFR